MDLDDLLVRFEREYQDPNSITLPRRAEQGRVLRRFAATLDRPLDEITAQDMTVFVGAEIARGVHPTTCRKYLNMIRSFNSWLADAGLITPERKVELKSVRNPRGSRPRFRPNPYKVSEIRAFRGLLAEKYPALRGDGPGSRAMRNFMHARMPQGCELRLRTHLWRHARRLQFEAQVALALELGLRRIEIHRLSIPAMHYDNDQVVVQTAKQGPGLKVTRVVPYTTHARNCVQEWLDFRRLLSPEHEQPWLMLDYMGALSVQLRPQSLEAMGKSLDVFPGPWRWHRFRHTAATEWLRSGVPLEKVSYFMGHSALEQTRAYTQILDRDVEHAFGKAEADFAARLGLAA